MLKEILSSGAFEQPKFVDTAFVIKFMPTFLKEKKYTFLINLICYEENLLNGTVS